MKNTNKQLTPDILRKMAIGFMEEFDRLWDEDGTKAAKRKARIHLEMSSRCSQLAIEMEKK